MFTFVCSERDRLKVSQPGNKNSFCTKASFYVISLWGWGGSKWLQLVAIISNYGAFTSNAARICRAPLNTFKINGKTRIEAPSQVSASCVSVTAQWQVFTLAAGCRRSPLYFAAWTPMLKCPFIVYVLPWLRSELSCANLSSAQDGRLPSTRLSLADATPCARIENECSI